MQGSGPGVPLPAATAKLRVAIVDGEDLFRDLLRLGLGTLGHIEVVADFGDAQAALQEIPSLRPDVAILNIVLPGSLHGVHLGVALKRQVPRLGIVLLSDYADPELLHAVPKDLSSGWCYLLKKSVSSAEALGRAIQSAGVGFVVMDPALMEPAQLSHSVLRRLTPRQLDILALLAQGYTNSAIAARLCMAEKSVQNQINLIYQQLDIDRDNPGVQPRVTAALTYWQERGRTAPFAAMDEAAPGAAGMGIGPG